MWKIYYESNLSSKSIKYKTSSPPFKYISRCVLLCYTLLQNLMSRVRVNLLNHGLFFCSLIRLPLDQSFFSPMANWDTFTFMLHRPFHYSFLLVGSLDGCKLLVVGLLRSVPRRRSSHFTWVEPLSGQRHNEFLICKALFKILLLARETLKVNYVLLLLIKEQYDGLSGTSIGTSCQELLDRQVCAPHWLIAPELPLKTHCVQY